MLQPVRTAMPGIAFVLAPVRSVSWKPPSDELAKLISQLYTPVLFIRADSDAERVRRRRTKCRPHRVRVAGPPVRTDERSIPRLAVRTGSHTIYNPKPALRTISRAAALAGKTEAEIECMANPHLQIHGGACAIRRCRKSSGLEPFAAEPSANGVLHEVLYSGTSST